MSKDRQDRKYRPRAPRSGRAWLANVAVGGGAGLLLALAMAAPAAACPDYGQRASEGYAIPGPALRDPATFVVVAGGGFDLADCPHIQPGTDRGGGYFTDQPDFAFLLRDMAALRLTLAVVSDCDAALLINSGAAGWFYDDDDNGNYDPVITLDRPADGRLDVWIGTYDGDYCNARLTLSTAQR